MYAAKLLSFGRPMIVLMLILVPSIALGHPGHGTSGDSNSIMHYITSPMHAVPVGLGLLAAVFVIRRILKSNSADVES